ncbi:DUF6270 domain-containing protein [Promicromonospora iranensis]|jgi:hypothetical protein|uniref:DUF6270 domain-containing protein n=1 Tax=Promicromonospora iranensis TaxID=1105144 RepID=UPI0023A9652E|nr:DUF6270 domain-containing protein [Promicromonospora iranensis]
MSKTRVFIYGSCVSRDTFEHLDPEHFELVEYVARQSVLSAYTKPVELMAPPTLKSRFQQRMITGDFSSSLRSLLATHSSATDFVLVDLTDERLGAYMLPDGSFVTRSVELIESGGEQYLPQGTKHIAFGTQQHFDYWTTAMEYVGEQMRTRMPQATIVLLDIPWAEWSETGSQTPGSFGMQAPDANPVFRSYARMAAQALGAHVISMEPSEVVSSPHHPWGDAPFHYAEKVYLEIVRRLTGAEGRVVWGAEAQRSASATGSGATATLTERAPAEEVRSSQSSSSLHRLPEGRGPNFLIAGAKRSGTAWIEKQLSYHPDVFVTSGGPASNFFNDQKRLADPKEREAYLGAFDSGASKYRRGERSVLYFWEGLGNYRSPRRAPTASNVAEMLDPNAPVLLTLRDPVSRAVSAYWTAVSNGQLDLSQQSIFRAPASLGIIDLSHYRRHYEAWSTAISAGRLHISLYDDIVNDPQAVVARVLNALELPETPEFWAKTTLKRRVNHKSWVAAMKKSGQVSAQEIAVLLELFEDDIAFLEDVLNRRLDAWRDLKKLVAINTK